MFPLLVIGLIALMVYGQGDFGGSNGSLLGSKKRNNATSVFVFEVTPNSQETSMGDGAEFLLRYENNSGRRLSRAGIRVVVPPGAVFDKEKSEDGFAIMESGAIAEYFLKEISPGEKGEVKFALQMKEKRNEDFSPRLATAIATWSEEEDTLLQATVQTRVLLAEAREKKPSSLASAQKIAVGSKMGLGLLGVFLIFLSWYVFSLFERGSGEEIKKKEKFAAVKEEIVAMRKNTKSAPPDNLPI
ncbi:hypothetical protein L0Y69_00195 [bacterium]|nr:hypothetical protein [bacterium]